MKQKFKSGTFVWISPNLGPAMGHFTKDCPALVLGTYAQEYGGDDYKSYSLLIKKDNVWTYSSWYYEHNLSKIVNKKDIAQYRQEIKARKQKTVILVNYGE